MPPHPISCYRGIGQCIGRKKAEIKRKEPDFKRNQVLFGGDYWTRTSDLLRVKYSIILSQNIVEWLNRVISRKIET